MVQSLFTSGETAIPCLLQYITYFSSHLTAAAPSSPGHSRNILASCKELVCHQKFFTATCGQVQSSHEALDANRAVYEIRACRAQSNFKV